MASAVESAVRWVINLRVKSNATYWLRENAETMIRLRGWVGVEEAVLCSSPAYRAINGSCSNVAKWLCSSPVSLSSASS